MRATFLFTTKSKAESFGKASADVNIESISQKSTERIWKIESTLYIIG